MSYADLEYLRREQEILKQQLREKVRVVPVVTLKQAPLTRDCLCLQSAVINQLQVAMHDLSREKEEVMKAFRSPSADLYEYAAPHRGSASVSAAHVSYETAARDHMEAGSYRGPSVVRGPPTPPPQRLRQSSAHQGSPSRAVHSVPGGSGRRSEPVMLREHSEWIAPHSAGDDSLNDTLRVVGSERPYTAVHSFPGQPLKRAPL